jgi:hypothetical protein
MTDAERIARLEEDNHILMGLLHEAITAMAPRDRGRHPGEPINMRYASDRAFQRLIRDIESLEPLHLVDDDGDAA